MIRRGNKGLALQISLIAVVCSAVLWVACSSPSDLVSADAGLDAPVFDAAPPPQEASATASCDLGDGGVAPQGKQVVASPSVFILGVTSDGYAVYEDRQAGKIYTVPIAGGPPEQVGPSWDGSSTIVSIFGNVVLYWTGVDFTRSPRFGQLVVWTAAGHSRILSASSIAGTVAVADDGKLIAYSEKTVVTFPPADAGTTTGTGTTDLVVAAPNGSGKITMASNVVWSSECQPSVNFVGTRVVTASCSAPKLPQPAATIRAYAGPAFNAPATLNSVPAYTVVGHDAARIFYYTGGIVLTVQSVTGSPIPVMGNVYTASLSHDGTFIVILNNNGGFYRSPTASASVSLIAPGFNDFVTLSPDDKWILASKNYDPNLGLSDLHIMSSAPNSTATQIVATATAGFFKDSFTKDNTRVMFGANNKKAPYGFFGDFQSVPVSAPATPPLTLSGTSWDGWALKGSKVVFDDGYDLVFPALPLADIQVVDLANPTTKTKLVSKADANFYVDADRTKAIYSWTYCADSRAGLYVVDLP